MVALTSPWSATSKASSVVGTAANCIGAVGRTCSAALPLPASAACADLVGAVLAAFTCWRCRCWPGSRSCASREASDGTNFCEEGFEARESACDVSDRDALRQFYSLGATRRQAGSGEARPRTFSADASGGEGAQAGLARRLGATHGLGARWRAAGGSAHRGEVGCAADGRRLFCWVEVRLRRSAPGTDNGTYR